MRPALLLALALLVLGSGTAQAVCRYAGPERSAEQRDIDDAIGSREIWGLPRSRAFVKRLQRDPAARERGYERLDFPMTVREAAYFDDRLRVEGEARSVGAVAERVRGLSGGVSIEDDFPRGAYVRLRITRKLRAGERRSLERRARRLSLPRVEVSERILRRLSSRISGDSDALEAAGIAFQSSGADIDRNQVELTYSATRPDAEAFLRARYGRKVHLVQVPASQPGCDVPTGYAIAPDDLALTLFWGTSGSAFNHRVEVRESPDRVLVGAVSDFPPFVTADLRFTSATTTLAAPLGTRKVVAIPTRKPVPVRTPE